MSTILLADDDHLLRLIMRERLERSGHEVIECGDGFAALELATAERPDCLVLDVMMPLARGLEVVRQVRRQDDWRPGIVMVSARTRVTDRLNALDAGADLYLEKPLAPDALVEAVARVTADRTPTRLVDILGPVWATLAMDRLLARAARRRPATDTAALQMLFRDQVLATLGRRPADLPAPNPAMRVLWEQALRTLLGDALDPDVPIATAIRVPSVSDALTATGGPAALTPPDPATAAMWAQTLARVIAIRPTTRLEHQFATSLAHVLGIDERDGGRWPQVLADVLGHHQPLIGGAGANIEATVSAALGDALGIHSAETDHWARILTRVMAVGPPRADDALEAAFGATLRRSLSGTPGTALTLHGDHHLWATTMDRVLRDPEPTNVAAPGHPQPVGRP